LKEARNLLSGKREPKTWKVLYLNGEPKIIPEGYENRQPEDFVIKINIKNPKT
jgi:hypothetical protein